MARNYDGASDAVYILERIMGRTRWTPDVRDRLALHLERIERGGIRRKAVVRQRSSDMFLPTVYITVVYFPDLGIGSAGDATDDRAQAYTDYEAAANEAIPSRVFRLEFDVETNALETSREITGVFHDEYEALLEERT